MTTKASARRRVVVVALSLNVTALNATALSFLTIWAGGERPLAASLNPAPGEPPTPNAVTVDLSVDPNREFWTDDHGISAGDPYVPFSSTRAFPTFGEVSTTYRLVCDQNNGDVEIRDSTITALWLSAAY